MEEQKNKRDDEEEVTEVEKFFSRIKRRRKIVEKYMKIMRQR